MIRRLKKAMLRRGTLGNTARWAAAGYTALESGSDPGEMFAALIDARYAVGVDPIGDPIYASFLKERIADQRIETLLDLVMGILSVETPMAIDHEIIADVIGDELARAGVPHDVIGTFEVWRDYGFGIVDLTTLRSTVAAARFVDAAERRAEER